MADFDSWSKESLVQFAFDAQRRMREQAEEIALLQKRVDWAEQDTLACLTAYRELLRGWPSTEAAKGAARH